MWDRRYNLTPNKGALAEDINCKPKTTAYQKESQNSFKGAEELKKKLSVAISGPMIF